MTSTPTASSSPSRTTSGRRCASPTAGGTSRTPRTARTGRGPEDPDGGETWTWNGSPLWSAGILHPRRPLADVRLRDVYATLTADRPAGGTVDLILDYARPDDATTGEETSVVLRVDDAGVSLTARRADAGGVVAPVEAGSPPAPGRVELSLSSVDGVLRARVGDAAVPRRGTPWPPGWS